MREKIDGRQSLLSVDRLMDFVPARWRRGAAIVPVVRLSGVIGAVTPLRPGMTLAGVARMLERAFATRNAKAVALVINSPVDRRCNHGRFICVSASSPRKRNCRCWYSWKMSRHPAAT